MINKLNQLEIKQNIDNSVRRIMNRCILSGSLLSFKVYNKLEGSLNILENIKDTKQALH